jgi:hypothetical protein
MDAQIIICKESDFNKFLMTHKLTPNTLFNIGNGRINKPTGGLWTSSACDKYLSDWVKWCIDNCQIDWATGMNAYKLIPKSTAKIFTIDSKEDADLLANKYGVTGQYTGSFLNVDWVRISKDYDAVHLTYEGQIETRMIQKNSLYGWDCESTVWFRDVFEKIECLGIIDISESENNKITLK